MNESRRTSSPASVPGVDNDDRAHIWPEDYQTSSIQVRRHWTIWRIVDYLGCQLMGHAIYTIGWPLLVPGDTYTFCIHCKLTERQMQKIALVWYTLILAAILLLTGCLPEVRQPDPKCILIDVRWDEGHVTQMTEQCGDTLHTFRPVQL